MPAGKSRVGYRRACALVNRKSRETGASPVNAKSFYSKGLPGQPVREMLIEAVERRFGAVESAPAGHELEFTSDNGGAYIAADTGALARSLRLKPINTPVGSPQSKGMAESFVNTFKRDYVARMDLSNAPTVLAQLPAAFKHFNEVHSHSSLKMRPPREFRRNGPQWTTGRFTANRAGPGIRGQNHFQANLIAISITKRVS